MLDTSSNNTDAIVEDLYFCMEGVVTAGISKSIRDADMGVAVHAGDYIGFIGKDILCADESRKNATTALIDNMDLSSHDILIFVYGKDTDTAEVEFIQDYIEKKAPSTELYTINGEQDIYSYILIAE